MEVLMVHFKDTSSRRHPTCRARYKGPGLTLIALIFLILFPYTFSFGDGGATFTLYNATSYYLHAVINGKPYTYIAPGGSVQSDVGFGGVIADVSYSPGQNIKGKGSKSFDVQISTTTSGTGSSTCSDNNRSKTCTSSTESESNTVIAPISWTITSADLQ